MCGLSILMLKTMQERSGHRWGLSKYSGHTATLPLATAAAGGCYHHQPPEPDSPTFANTFCSQKPPDV